MNIGKRFKQMSMWFVLACVPLVGGCGDTILKWDEDVQLLDGRVIKVVQKRRIDRSRMERESWLTIRMPEFSENEIVWHEDLRPVVLNVYQGKLLLVGFADSLAQFERYGQPSPPYVGFRYNKNEWVRIPFTEIPTAIYETNMYFENMSIARRSYVGLGDKAVLQRTEEYPLYLKKIDPKYVSKSTGGIPKKKEE